MGTEWSETTLGDIALGTDGAVDGPFGSNLPASAYTENGYPIIRGSNLTVGLDDFKDHEFVYVPEEVFQRLSRSECKAGDIIFTKKGTLGQTGLIRSEHRFDRYLLSSNQMRLRVDPSKALPEYVYYCVSSQKAINKLIKDSECTGVPKINLAYLKSFPISLPDLGTQKSIVDVLGALNKKITLNRQINQTLEQMAQTLFKSWFVDFDPVMDNALDAGNPIPDELQHRAEARKTVRESEGFKPLPDDVRQLFPDAFEESELGWVPKGWGVSTAGDEFTVKGGSTPSTKNAEFWEDGDIHWTSPKDLSGKAEKIMLDTERKITAAGLKKITSGLLPENSVLMSSRAPIGYLALAKIPVAINQGYIAIPSTTRLSQEYVLYWLDSSIDEIKGIAGGTTFAEISKHTFKSIKMIVPDSKVTDIFSNLAKGYLDKITLNVKEVATLTKLRDTLLPKLISGELRLDEIELAVEEEAVSA
ncbi:TPA: restriction endonuclease subunit S [Vibrio cholerae]|uniref:restriction endonuclease subunit S n=1 Tax=Vibrio cholerae TaxID=666 RepID=UPI00061548CE|nr:restriction endonuclease subunit S [Vibrio cholerae]AKB07920.1 type I restriction modification DNA specificity domain protein [Vibrio cholerae]EKF9450026.1 restriction endonuclease subunit S [Vibrio cholerae]GHY95844.1 type I restriction modification DNA specificity domain protein [Vibrio cholerae]